MSLNIYIPSQRFGAETAPILVCITQPKSATSNQSLYSHYILNPRHFNHQHPATQHPCRLPQSGKPWQHALNRFYNMCIG